MNAKTILLLAVAMAGAGYHFWHQHQQAQQRQAILANADANGFLALPRPDAVNPNEIIILAARNCPRAGARRARAMERALADRHIPHALRDSIHFEFSASSQPKIPGLNLVMNGATPIVLIHGRGKANPTLDEVLAEYTGVADAAGQSRQPIQ